MPGVFAFCHGMSLALTILVWPSVGAVRAPTGSASLMINLPAAHVFCSQLVYRGRSADETGFRTVRTCHAAEGSDYTKRNAGTPPAETRRPTDGAGKCPVINRMSLPVQVSMMCRRV